jgi:hypothetical protein
MPSDDATQSPRGESAAEQHARLRADAPYQAQLQTLNELTSAFIQMLRVTWLASTRDPESLKCLSWRFVDDLLASAAGIVLLVREGIENPARRELRFMLELVVRNLYVDIVVASRTTPLATRLAYVEHRLRQRDLELLGEIPFALVTDRSRFTQEVKRLYSELSRYTHPSHEQLVRRLEQSERGIYIGFETASELEAFNELLKRAYDILLVFVFEALGADSTGDVFINVIDERDDWPFTATTFLPEVSRHYDYKSERGPSRPRPA